MFNMIVFFLFHKEYCFLSFFKKKQKTTRPKLQAITIAKAHG